MPVLVELLANELALIASVILGIALHEAAHAAAGRLGGLRPYLLTLGAGPILCRFRIGRLWVVLRLRPFTGFVSRFHLLPGQGAAAILAAAAGPGVNILLAALLYAASRSWPSQEDLLTILAGVQLALALVTLAPYRWKRGGFTVQSDGLRLLRLIFRGAARTEAAQAYAALAGLVVPAGTKLPPRTPDGLTLMFHLQRNDRVEDDWAARDAFAGVRSLLEAGRLNAIEQALAHELLAGLAMLYPGCEASRAALDAWTQAGEAAGATAWRRLTRVCVLARLGRPEDAWTLLEATSQPPGPAGVAAAALARAATQAAQGRAPDARVTLADARQAVGKPLSRVLRRAETRLAAALTALCLLHPAAGRAGVADFLAGCAADAGDLRRLPETLAAAGMVEIEPAAVAFSALADLVPPAHARGRSNNPLMLGDPADLVPRARARGRDARYDRSV